MNKEATELRAAVLATKINEEENDEDIHELTNLLTQVIDDVDDLAFLCSMKITVFKKMKIMKVYRHRELYNALYFLNQKMNHRRKEAVKKRMKDMFGEQIQENSTDEKEKCLFDDEHTVPYFKLYCSDICETLATRNNARFYYLIQQLVKAMDSSYHSSRLLTLFQQFYEDGFSSDEVADTLITVFSENK